MSSPDFRMGPDFPAHWMFARDAAQRLQISMSCEDFDHDARWSELRHCLDEVTEDLPRTRLLKLQTRRHALLSMLEDWRKGQQREEEQRKEQQRKKIERPLDLAGKTSPSQRPKRAVSRPNVSDQPTSSKQKHQRLPHKHSDGRNLDRVRTQFSQFYSATAYVPDDVALERLTPEHYYRARVAGFNVIDVGYTYRAILTLTDRKAGLDRVIARLADDPDTFGCTDDRIAYLRSLEPLTSNQSGMVAFRALCDDTKVEERKLLRALGVEFFGQYVPELQCDIMGRILLWRAELGVEQVRELLLPPVPEDHPNFEQLDRKRVTLGSRSSTVLRGVQFPQRTGDDIGRSLVE